MGRDYCGCSDREEEEDTYEKCGNCGVYNCPSCLDNYCIFCGDQVCNNCIEEEICYNCYSPKYIINCSNTSRFVAAVFMVIMWRRWIHNKSRK